MSDEKLEVLIDECEDDGNLKDTESEFIKSVIEFDNIEVGELCIPKIDFTILSKNASAVELSDLLTKLEFSRIPVYNDSIDDIVEVATPRTTSLGPIKASPARSPTS